MVSVGLLGYLIAREQASEAALLRGVPRVNQLAFHVVAVPSAIDGLPDGETLRNSSQRKVEVGVNMVHMVTWKFILIALTKLSIEGTPLDAAAILEAAQRRIKRRLDSLKVGIHTKVVRAQAREDEPNFRLTESASGLAE